MNRRLRKKLHKGEFNYLGFEVSGEFDPPLTDGESDRLLDEFIAFIEAHDLASGGGFGHRDMQQYLTRMSRVRRIGPDRYRWRQLSCTESDRDLLRDWLESHSRCRNWRVSPLNGSWSSKKR